jgi:predicted phage terminase large subunit-like protein
MEVSLHSRQEEVFYDDARYKVVAAGRRFGKSFLAAVTLFVETSKTHKVRSDGEEIDLALEKVYYVAPTFTQGKEILWPVLKELGQDLIAQAYENEASLRLLNGRTIHIKGADRPNSLRGTGLSYVVLDEYAFMKEEVWEMIISPQLSRSEGGALFIGTPDGKNHFYELFQRGYDEGFPTWKSWHFGSIDNPYLPSTEIEEMRDRMSAERFAQEAEASFEGGAGLILTADMFHIVDAVPYPCDYYIAADLAGFQSTEGGRKIKKLDDHAIAVVANHAKGWCIVDIIYGQWDTRETALRLVKAYRDYRPRKFGIEKGMSKNAVMPYLEDEQNRLGTFFMVTDLTHGNQHKTDRIAWALQGRAEKGRVSLLRGEWNREFLSQAQDFPSKLAHDDLVDAVAYIDQLADPWWEGPDFVDDWEPLDDLSGY